MSEKKEQRKIKKSFYEKYGESLPEHIEEYIDNRTLQEREKLVGERSFCILRNSEELKKLLKNRRDYLGYSSQEIASYLRVSTNRVSKYFRKGYHYSLSQKHILLLADYLGVHINVKFEVNPYYIKRRKPKDIGFEKFD
jgi:predicted transcriptional regulator